MTAFTPDRPDWTKEDTGSVVYAEQAVIGPGGNQSFGLEGVASYTILAGSQAINTPVVLSAEFTVNQSLVLPIGVLALSAFENDTLISLLIAESPSYGGVLKITNLNPTDPVFVNVYSSNRSVQVFRYTLDNSPGRTFVNNAGFTAAAPASLETADNGGTGYAANVNAAFTINSTGAGQLDFYYRDALANPQIIPVGMVAIGVTQFASIPLPQCVGVFYFTPTLNDPAGVITVLAYPVRT